MLLIMKYISEVTLTNGEVRRNILWQMTVTTTQRLQLSLKQGTINSRLLLRIGQPMLFQTVITCLLHLLKTLT